MGNILGISETALIQLLLVSVAPVARPPELLGPTHPLHTPHLYTDPLQPQVFLFFSLSASCTPPLSHNHASTPPDLPSCPNFQFSFTFQGPASLPHRLPSVPRPRNCSPSSRIPSPPPFLLGPAVCPDRLSLGSFHLWFFKS